MMICFNLFRFKKFCSVFQPLKQNILTQKVDTVISAPLTIKWIISPSNVFLFLRNYMVYYDEISPLNHILKCFFSCIFDKKSLFPENFLEVDIIPQQGPRH